MSHFCLRLPEVVASPHLPMRSLRSSQYDFLPKSGLVGDCWPVVHPLSTRTTQSTTSAVAWLKTLLSGKERDVHAGLTEVREQLKEIVYSLAQPSLLRTYTAKHRD